MRTQAELGPAPGPVHAGAPGARSGPALGEQERVPRLEDLDVGDGAFGADAHRVAPEVHAVPLATCRTADPVAVEGEEGVGRAVGQLPGPQVVAECRLEAGSGQVAAGRRLRRRAQGEVERLHGDVGRVQPDVHVGGRDGCGRVGVDDRPLGASQFDRGEDALVERQVAGDAMGQHHQEFGRNDVGLGVEVMVRLGRGAFEVQDHVVAFDRQGAGDLVELVAVLGPRGGLVDAVLQGEYAPSHLGLGQLADGAQAVGEAVATDAVDQAHHLLLGGVAAGDESAQVHLHDVGHADVVDQDVPDVGHLLALAEQADGRAADPFLVALGGLRCEGADDHPTHVHHVGRQPDPSDQIALVEDRLLDHDVLGVQPPAVVRVVGEEHVPGGHRVAEARRSSP